MDAPGSQSQTRGQMAVGIDTCDLCGCEAHEHEPCVNCLNCVGYYRQESDPWEDHTDTVPVTKPHYVYNARTGVYTPKKPPVQKITE